MVRNRTKVNRVYLVFGDVEWGADLGRGIPLNQLSDGGRLVGHFNGEDLLLVWSGDEIFAISPHCTHYNVLSPKGL
jgi:hypothetical protein